MNIQTKGDKMKIASAKLQRLHGQRVREPVKFVVIEKEDLFKDDFTAGAVFDFAIKHNSGTCQLMSPDGERVAVRFYCEDWNKEIRTGEEKGIFITIGNLQSFIRLRRGQTDEEM